MWSHVPCKHQVVWVQGHTLGICILHVLVFDNSSVIYIDLLSQGPGLNLFSEVWATSMAALAPPSSLLPHHLTLKFTDYCQHNVAIFTCLRRLFNGSVFSCTAITQHLQIFKGLRRGVVRVVHIGKLLNANLRYLREENWAFPQNIRNESVWIQNHPGHIKKPIVSLLESQPPKSIKWTALLLIIMGPLLVAPMDLFFVEKILSPLRQHRIKHSSNHNVKLSNSKPFPARWCIPLSGVRNKRRGKVCSQIGCSSSKPRVTSRPLLFFHFHRLH